MKHSLLALLLALFTTAATSQEVRTYTTNEEDSMACIQNLSLYYEFYKQDNFNNALPAWRKAVEICPKSRTSLYVYGAEMYEDLIKKTEDATLKAKYVDSLMWVYDMRIEHFDERGYVLGRKGADMAKYQDNPKAAYDVLSESFELQGNDMEPGALIYLYKSAYDQVKAKTAEKQLLFDLYPVVSEVVEYNIANQQDARMKGAYQTAQENIDKMFAAVAECSDLVNVYLPKLTASPDDEKLLRQIVKVFEKRDCGDTEVFQKAAVSLYKIEPSAEAAYAIATSYAKKENYSGSAEYYVKAAEQAQDAGLKQRALNKAANSYLLAKQYSTAKRYALEMLKLDPNNGEAYIIIGDAYVGGRKDCGGNECTGRAAYWAAADKYAYAKSVDPGVAETANKRLATATAQFPKKEDCFFHSLTEGSSYTLECWIGETTTVRTRN